MVPSKNHTLLIPHIMSIKNPVEVQKAATMHLRLLLSTITRFPCYSNYHPNNWNWDWLVWGKRSLFSVIDMVWLTNVNEKAVIS